MLDTIEHWWSELTGGSKSDEVPMKTFLNFALKKRIILDEKELESLFKDMNGDERIADHPFLKKSEYQRVFSRSCFKGALQNIFEFIDKSSIIMRCQPLAIKILSYQRDLLYAGMASISDPSANKRGLDGNLILKAFKHMERPMKQRFASVKEELLGHFYGFAKMSQDGGIFDADLKRAFFGELGGEGIDDNMLLEVIGTSEG